MILYTRKSFLWFYVGIFSVLLVLVFIDYKAQRTIHSMSYVAYGCITLQNSFLKPFVYMNTYFSSVKTLESMLRIEKLKNEELTAQLVAAHAQEHFWHDAHDLIEFHKRYKAAHQILSHCMVKHLSDQGHYILVDKGSAHGVNPDMVALYKNCLVGRVAEIFPYYTKIVLLTDRSCKVAVECAQTKTPGVYEGADSLEHGFLSHVSHIDALKLDDMLITSGQGLVIPKGFGVGKIKHFYVKDVEYVVHIEPLINIQDLTYFYLVDKCTLGVPGSDQALQESHENAKNHENTY
jgi:rod shape-determining protein MreC